MIKILSLFSGIGAFETALKRLGIDYELAAYCEIDKYASKAYSMLHNVSEELNLKDVRTLDTSDYRLKGVNLITYGFPCQDISFAGRQKGFEYNGEKTRSGLFFDALRIISDLKPEYAIAENVKALTGTKFKAEFAAVLRGLSDAGYNNYWSVLNAKDYGIPQNRERVFIVSIRKDIDTGDFVFPPKQELTLKCKDLLEPVVDEKYYINTEKAKNLIWQITDKYNLTGATVVDSTINSPKVKDISNCITARYDAGIGNQKSIGTAIIEPMVSPINAYDDGTARTIKSQYYKTSIANLTRTGTQGATGVTAKISDTEWRIRKLTPKECWRLMGFTDSEFDSVKGISNTQLYKQAGNSIVVNVLVAIFRNLFKVDRETIQGNRD